MKYLKKQMILLAVIGMLLSNNALAEVPFPPGQPELGPGGYTYEYADVIVNGPYWAEEHEGDDSFRYYLYEPANPASEEAPVILFLHGWLAISKGVLNRWIWVSGAMGSPLNPSCGWRIQICSKPPVKIPD